MSEPTLDIEGGPDEILHYAACSDIGMRREENQDSFGIFEFQAGKLFVVADGMGGVKGGAVASQLAIRVLDEYLQGRSSLTIEDIATGAIQANSAIFDRGIAQPDLAGMGTTMVGLCFQGSELSIVNVGDSRAYRVREGDILQLTEDHTLVTELLRSGAITEDQVENHPVAHMLTRSLGPTPLIEVDCWVCESPPLPGDVYLLCSDGLYNMVHAHEMAEIATEYEPTQAAERFVELANARGGTDNITVIVIKLETPRDEDKTVEETAELDPPISVPSPLLTDTLELQEPPAGVRREETAEPRPVASPQNGWSEKANGHCEPIASPEIKASISLSNDELLEREREGRALREEHEALVREKVVQVDVPKPVEPEKPREPEKAAPPPDEQQETARPVKQRLATPWTAVALMVVFSSLGYMIGVSYRLDFTVRDFVRFDTEKPAPAPAGAKGDVDQPAVDTTSSPQKPLEPVAAQESVQSEPPELPAEPPAEVEPVEPPAPPVEPRLEREDFPQVARAKLELRQRLARLEDRVAAFSKPLSAEMEKSLSVGRLHLVELQARLRELQEKKKVAEYKNMRWVGRSRRLINRTPDMVTRLGQEIAPVEPAVNEVWQSFVAVSNRWQKEDETLSYNPNDAQQKLQVDRLWQERAVKLREVAAVLQQVIDTRKNEAAEAIAELTLEQDALERDIAEQQQEVDFLAALFSGDTPLKNKVKKDLVAQRDAVELQLREHLRLLPDPVAAPAPPVQGMSSNASSTNSFLQGLE